MYTSDHRSGRVLVVDDLAPNRQLIRAMLERDGHDVLEADSGPTAIRLAVGEDPDLVILDVLMPGLDGFETCAALKDAPETRLTPVVLLTALKDRADRLRGLEAGADEFLSRPVDPIELAVRVRSLIALRRRTRDLDSAEAVIVSLAQTIEARDAATEGHCERLARYGVEVGRALHLSSDDLLALERGGFLHDIGKVGVPDTILLKPGRLTEDEFEVVKGHTVIGSKILAESVSSVLRAGEVIAHSHHERWDGGGYPDGLSAEAIPLGARIIFVADAFDAMTSDRVYQPRLSTEDALAELERCAGSQFDPELVAALVEEVAAQPSAVLAS